MSEIALQIHEIAKSLEGFCSYIDVRDDEHGPFVFAFGHSDTHSLQLRKIENRYVLELWRGKNSEEEKLTSEPSFTEARAALDAAKEWLGRDAI